MEIESPAAAVKVYRRAKLVARCGAVQSPVVSESVSGGAFTTSGAGSHGCTVNSTGTRPGLFAAFSASMITVSRYTPMGSPAGLNAMRKGEGAVPLVSPTNASQALPSWRCATQERVPGPPFATDTLSAVADMLPTGAESRTCPGASMSRAIGGGLLVSLSTWQVARKRRRGATTAARQAPRTEAISFRDPRLVQEPSTTSP